MAAGRTYACSACAHAVTAWDDGNPYYRDEAGQKVYAHHPSPDRDRCTGNDTPVLCLACGAKAESDSAAPLRHCPACSARRLVATWRLDGKLCPYCGQGRFTYDPRDFMIS
jgi:DNA-directed RNA polymerase subunit RPC12/RpoP